MTFSIVADDLTGACDTGALFCGGGSVGVFVEAPWPDRDPPVAALDTNTRALAPHDAAARVTTIARAVAVRLGAGCVLKKIDSTMRGAVGAEIDALLDVMGLDTALVCPAFPEQRRIVLDGTLLVDGQPAHATAIARDPTYRGVTSVMAELLAGQTSRPIAALSLKDVRGSAADLGRAIDERHGHLVLADAETRADLDALAGSVVARPAVLVAGSAGLARSCAAELGLAGGPVPSPAGGAWLFVVGSLHPATRRQLRALEAAGVAGAWIDDAGPPPADGVASALAAGRPAFVATVEAASIPREEAAAALARLAAGVLQRCAPAALLVTGGETARALMAAVGARRLDLRGSPGSGLALARVSLHAGAAAPAIDIITKAGGFGPTDLFLQIMTGAL